MTAMQEATLEYVWEPYGEFSNKSVKPGRWMIRNGGNAETVRELLTFLWIDLDYNPERLSKCTESLEGFFLRGDGPPGLVAAGPDGGMYCGAGHVLIASDYADDSRVVMSAEQALTVFKNVAATTGHPDFANPDATAFEPFTFEIIETGTRALDEYYRRGGITPTMPEEYRT